MESYKDQWAAATKAAREILDSAPEGGTLSEEQQKEADDLLTKAADFKSKHEAQVKAAAQRQALAGLEPDEETPVAAAAEKPAKSLGEHFVKSGTFDRVKEASGAGRFTVTSPEFKAAADPILTSDVSGGLPTQYGQTIATRYRDLTIANLLAKGTLSGTTLTYYQQGTVTGDTGTVAEGAAKPNINFDFNAVTEALSKIAGVTKVSDEMTQDADFMVSIIQSQLLTRLSLTEEDQLLNGSGSAPNLRGILNRSGIQTYATPATSTPLKTLNGIFHSIQLVKNNSFLAADGIVINPTDYENVRLGLDGQSQFYGGGPFTGAYGNDGFSLNPALWTLPTVVTPAIAAGTVLVGSFQQGAQLFRKGGVRLESTNSNEDDFKKNLIALRVEERVALAVYYPAAFVKMTITA